MTLEEGSAAEFVLTLPTLRDSALYGRQTRTTMGVLVQLFAEAKENVVLGAPFMQAGHGLSEGPLAIAANAALVRGISVDVLGTEAGLAEINLDRLSRGATAALRTWLPAEEATQHAKLGFHAKFCLADDARAYIGSANFTGPGLETQLEMGVLTHGALARQVRDFWHLACRTNFVVMKQEVPGRRPRHR